MSDQVCVIGRVTEVKAVKSLGVTRIMIEVPVEAHKAATQHFFDEDVVLVLGGVANRSYGVYVGDQVNAQAGDEEVGGTLSYGSYYKALYVSGFFNNPKLWAWAGTDADYQAWVRQQPSCLSKKRDCDPDTGKEQCEYAHVRRANASGTGIKPEYCGVPLTHREHQLQHQSGEFELLKGFWSGASTDEAREWFDKKAVEYRTAWIKSALYSTLGVNSLSEVKPSDFSEVAKVIGVYSALPSSFKGFNQ